MFSNPIFEPLVSEKSEKTNLEQTRTSIATLLSKFDQKKKKTPFYIDQSLISENDSDFGSMIFPPINNTSNMDVLPTLNSIFRENQVVFEDAKEGNFLEKESFLVNESFLEQSSAFNVLAPIKQSGAFNVPAPSNLQMDPPLLSKENNNQKNSVSIPPVMKTTDSSSSSLLISFGKNEFNTCFPASPPCISLQSCIKTPTQIEGWKENLDKREIEMNRLLIEENEGLLKELKGLKDVNDNLNREKREWQETMEKKEELIYELRNKLKLSEDKVFSLSSSISSAFSQISSQTNQILSLQNQVSSFNLQNKNLSSLLERNDQEKLNLTKNLSEKTCQIERLSVLTQEKYQIEQTQNIEQTVIVNELLAQKKTNFDLSNQNKLLSSLLNSKSQEIFICQDEIKNLEKKLAALPLPPSPVLIPITPSIPSYIRNFPEKGFFAKEGAELDKIKLSLNEIQNEVFSCLESIQVVMQTLQRGKKKVQNMKKYFTDEIVDIFLKYRSFFLDFFQKPSNAPIFISLLFKPNSFNPLLLTKSELQILNAYKFFTFDSQFDLELNEKMLRISDFINEFSDSLSSSQIKGRRSSRNSLESRKIEYKFSNHSFLPNSIKLTHLYCEKCNHLIDIYKYEYHWRFCLYSEIKGPMDVDVIKNYEEIEDYAIKIDNIDSD